MQKDDPKVETKEITSGVFPSLSFLYYVIWID